MKNRNLYVLVIWLMVQTAFGQNQRNVINLNSIWDFDQTETAFPPARFTRKIQVPGLIHLAEPHIVEYDKFFKRPGKPVATIKVGEMPEYKYYDMKQVFLK